jgi:uncharacterized membrane protein YkgB
LLGFTFGVSDSLGVSILRRLLLSVFQLVNRNIGSWCGVMATIINIRQEGFGVEKF